MANSPTDILSTLQQGVIALNNLIQRINTVTSTSSGVATIRLTMVSTA